jgi:S-adenosylmethionine hydrolase
MILLFTDFGSEGPYLGQMEAILYRKVPEARVIRLLNDAPTGKPGLAGYLLAAICREFPPDSIFLAVVDPGVGGERLPVVLKADGRWFVGPDNDLFNTVAVQSANTEWWIIDWRPGRLSTSFHGRDLFSPVAARLARGEHDHVGRPFPGPKIGEWPVDANVVVYIDHYGNAMSGLRYSSELDGKTLLLGGRHLVRQAHTFSDIEPGEAFWYCNSSGLVEVAVNLGRADGRFGLQPGYPVGFQDGD